MGSLFAQVISSLSESGTAFENGRPQGQDPDPFTENGSIFGFDVFVGEPPMKSLGKKNPFSNRTRLAQWKGATTFLYGTIQNSSI